MAIRAEVVQLASASAHADGGQIIDWLRASPQTPRQVYVVHGEMQAADQLRQRIQQALGWQADMPEHGETVYL